MMHESNTFSCVSMDIETFKRTPYLIGEELIAHHTGKRTEPGGMLDIFTKKGVKAILSNLCMGYSLRKGNKRSMIKNIFIAHIKKILRGLMESSLLCMGQWGQKIWKILKVIY